jgi:hypothetical protein
MTGGVGHSGGPHHGHAAGGSMPGAKHYSIPLVLKKILTVRSGLVVCSHLPYVFFELELMIGVIWVDLFKKELYNMLCLPMPRYFSR